MGICNLISILSIAHKYISYVSIGGGIQFSHGFGVISTVRLILIGLVLVWSVPAILQWFLYFHIYIDMVVSFSVLCCMYFV